ncbi:hypothetical protein [Actinoplanes sp. NPDC051851]|uniref:hypothetical protein n=1 Tax=Actinoplanes sp. NPDC051851 TaxID=3154753 RepID=UPI00341F9E1B
MVSTLFALITAAEIALFALVLRHRRDRAIVLLIPVVLALIWDNAVIAVGAALGEGGLLHALSVPRFVTHALFVPLLIMVGALLGRRSGVRLPPTPAFALLTALLIGIGLVRDVIGLDLEPTRYAGTLRYTNAAASGPPIPAVATILVLIAIGAALAVRARRYWLLAGAITMFAAAGAGFAVPWLGNLGELVLIGAIGITALRTEYDDPVSSSLIRR